MASWKGERSEALGQRSSPLAAATLTAVSSESGKHVFCSGTPCSFTQHSPSDELRTRLQRDPSQSQDKRAHRVKMEDAQGEPQHGRWSQNGANIFQEDCTIRSTAHCTKPRPQSTWV